MRRLLFILLILPAFSAAGASFEMNAQCQQAYRDIMKLKFESGRSLLAAEKKANPTNRIPFLLENYIDFLTIYISEDKAFFERSEPKKEARLNSLRMGDKNSPYYLYSQAEIHMQWAFSRVKFGDYLQAVFEVKKANGLLNENAEKFPNFKPNQKSQALLKTLFGAIPDQYKFGAKILGLKGDIDGGVKIMHSLVQDKTFLFREETLILYTMLQLHLQKNETGAWQMIEQSGLTLGDNLLNHYVAASVAMHTGKNDKAIQLLSSRPKGAEYFPFPYLDFLMGQAKLNRLDKDADDHFHVFLSQFKGLTYIKDAYRRIAWYWLINGKPDQYKRYMLLAKAKGTQIVDEDKSAYKEAAGAEKPHAGLLKARLLFDGAYYSRALESLSAVVYDNLATKEKAEYLYRKARIFHESGKTADAISYYQKTIQATGTNPWYFAPNACIKIGNIYEKQGDRTKAEQFYKKALTYDDHEYQNSIDAEAKAGLNRIE